jgi:excinuclease ABC subunit C
MRHPWEKKIPLHNFPAENPLPETPGVYFFLGAGDEILYIGKASILADRVKSYFGRDLVETRGPKLVMMRERIAAIGWIPLDSVLEALLREGQLIKRFQPPYNTDAKDDKSYNFVVITKEAYPRLLLVRERDLETGKFSFPIREKFGPYPRGEALRTALRIVRKIFPYRDKCVPYAELSPSEQEKARPCFHAQIGLCPGVCVGTVSAAEYRKTVRRIALFFGGKKADLMKRLEREMQAAARDLRFEAANELKQLLFDLGHIRDVALMKADREEASAARIEAYDAAHLRGEATVGVMTVVQHALAKKSEYRLFTLRNRHGGNDVSALEEILTRRLAHTEWTLPELIVVDGTLLQSDGAVRILKKRGLTIPVVGVVKNANHRPDRIIGPRGLVQRFEKDILLANAEAHRFAIGFHRKKKREQFLRG